ncbi:PE family protein [Mycobacterium sp. UM_CSW]|uniref:PE family protein n=1 Tax=Mycobacterium sp. UM_CSW TaxID=1370119 RepID=UPI000424C1B2|nr:PE family protein [Mycobacterium sp. UM_CSW]
MSFVFATPEYLAAAASDLANIGSTISSANVAASGPTSGVLAAGADEVSASIAALFGAHAEVYQALSAQAALFHQQFVDLMSSGGAQYALAEATNASPLQTLEQGATSALSAPAQAAGVAIQAATGASGSPAAAAGVGPGAFGAGGSGAAGQLISSVGADPAAAAAGTGGTFSPGGAGLTGSLVAGQNFGAAPAAGGSIAPAESGGVVETAAAEDLGIGETPVASAPAVTPLAGLPTPGSAAPAAAARPGTPAYSPAPAGASEPAEE